MDKINDKYKQFHIRWLLVFYDVLIFAISCLLIFGLSHLSVKGMVFEGFLCSVFVFTLRFVFGVYRQIWRYGGIQSYIRLILADGFAFVLYYSIQRVCLTEKLSVLSCLAFVCFDLLGVLATRLIYRYTYKCCDRMTWYGRILIGLFTILGASEFNDDKQHEVRIKVAIIGGGRTGNALAEELFSSSFSSYEPVLFIDRNKSKTGREIHGIPVVYEDDITAKKLHSHDIQEVVLVKAILKEMIPTYLAS